MKKTICTLALAIAAAAVAIPAAPRPAAACGGCFAPPETVTSVDAHRMVISLSTGRTTLWDQIKYSGAPEDFVWVLPVPSGASVVELAEPAFFDELESQTAPVVLPPPIPRPDCPPPPPCDFCAGGAQDAGASAPDAAPVTVFQEETVGPYEMVVVGSESASALQDWLVAHSYQVPEATVPTIQHYVDRGSVFVVLRLSPGEGVNRMQPVRVRYPGYMATFPLKMVTVGAAGTLELTLWVISEQRYQTRAPYTAMSIADDELFWDWDTNSSNYGALFDQKVDEPGGRGWVTEFALPLAYLGFSSSTETDVAVVDIKNPYLTRLRTRMLVDHLGDDLELEPAAAVGNVYNQRQVPDANGLNVPVITCPDWDNDGEPDTWPAWWDAHGAPDVDANGCAAAGSSGATASGIAVGSLIGCVAVVLLAARRRRRHP